MYIKFNLLIQQKAGSNTQSVFTHVEATEDVTKDQLTEKVVERAKNLTIVEPKSCVIFVNGKEMANDWKWSNKDDNFEAKITKQ